MPEPCDESVIRAGTATVPCAAAAGKWVLAATILASTMAFIDGTVVNVALPAPQTDLHASVPDVQWVIEAYALFLAALLLVGGSLGDHYGRRRVFPDRRSGLCGGGGVVRPGWWHRPAHRPRRAGNRSSPARPGKFCHH